MSIEASSGARNRYLADELARQAGNCATRRVCDRSRDPVARTGRRCCESHGDVAAVVDMVADPIGNESTVPAELTRYPSPQPSTLVCPLAMLTVKRLVNLTTYVHVLSKRRSTERHALVGMRR